METVKKRLQKQKNLKGLENHTKPRISQPAHTTKASAT